MNNIEKTNISENEYLDDDARVKFDKSIIEALDNNSLSIVKSTLDELHPADIADLIDYASYEQKIKLIDLLGDQFDPQILVELSSTNRITVIKILGYEKSSHLISQLSIDDEFYVIENLEEDIREKILSYVDIKSRKEINELLAYPEHSAARIMQKKVVSLPEYWTVGQTIDYLRQNDDLPEEFYEVFVIDPKFRPIGSVLVSSILHQNRETVINSIMQTDIKVINTDLDQEQVSFLFRQYGLVSVPVVNKDGRLVGCITISDAVEIIGEEAEEDIMSMGGIKDTDFHGAILTTVRNRFPWLFVNLITACCVAFVISFFESTIQNAVVLAALMPIVASMGGNAGTQTMTMAVVAIATKELSAINAARVILKQIVSCAINGLLVALIGSLVLLLFYNDIGLSLIFAVSIIINFALAGFFGSAIPIILNRVGIDPAVASPVFLTAITDMFGFFTFLGLAALYLT